MNANVKQLFPTEEACSNILKAIHLDQGVKAEIAKAKKKQEKLNLMDLISNLSYEEVICPQCNGCRIYNLKCKGHEHNYKCGSCEVKNKFNEKTGTIFQGMQMDLCQGIAIIFLNNLKDVDFSIVELSGFAGVSTKSVSKLLKKIKFINDYGTLNDIQRQEMSKKLGLEGLDIVYNKQLIDYIIQCCLSNHKLAALESLLTEDTFSFISYPGSKAKLVKFLLSRFPKDFNAYFEPFIGGGSLFFGMNIADVLNSKKDRKFYISDQNSGLIDLYNDLKNNLKKLYKHFKKHAIAFNAANRDDKNTIWNSIRAIYNNGTVSGVERSAALLFLTKTTFRGAFDFSNGKFKGSCNKDNGCSLSRKTLYKMIRCSKILNNNVTIVSCSFEDIEHLLQLGDFVYLDPPYFSYKTDSIGYGSDLITRDGQKRIRDFLLRLHQKGVYFMVSNYLTPYLKDNLYNDKSIFNIEIIKVNRGISGKNKVEDEIIIRNYK